MIGVYVHFTAHALKLLKQTNAAAPRLDFVSVVDAVCLRGGMI